MTNPCIFSKDRRYRYTLEHNLSDLLTPTTEASRLILWIGLNPSTADETQLDPTLRRIAAFSKREHYGGFLMTNLFAFRATLPSVMKAESDPIGPENDHYLLASARRCEQVVAAWGAHGEHLGRASHVLRLLRGFPVVHLGLTREGHPLHPLYVKGTTAFSAFSA